jgi:hypothetical protein
MHISQVLPVVALASSAIASSAILLPRELHQFVPIEARQVSPEQYECHSDCGNSILNSNGDYCNDPAWIAGFEDCLACANDFNIWRHYGDGVTRVAEACGLDATPAPADDEGGGDADAASSTGAPSTTAAHVSSTGTTAEASSGSFVASPTQASTDAATTTEASATPSDLAVATTSLIHPTTSPNATSSVRPTVSVVPAAAGALERHSALAFGCAAIAVVFGYYQN